jgi:hypothetical protein
MPVLLSRADARRAAQACRALANHYRESADRLENIEAKAIKAHEAQELERIAQVFEGHAAGQPPGKVVPIRRT